MDLIYIILSIYLRLFQAALPLSRSATLVQKRAEPQQWAIWLPIVGWVSVLVKFVPQSMWLAWRVIDVQPIGEHRHARNQGLRDQRSGSRTGQHSSQKLPE